MLVDKTQQHKTLLDDFPDEDCRASGQQFGLFVKAEYDKWAKVIKAVDAQVN